MTRRVAVFVKEDGTQLHSAEFNGDKAELSRLGSLDSCAWDWDEIFTVFKGVKTEKDFAKANVKAQGYYYSHLDPIAPARAIRVTTHAAGTELPYNAVVLNRKYIYVEFDNSDSEVFLGRRVPTAIEAAKYCEENGIFNDDWNSVVFTTEIPYTQARELFSLGGIRHID